MRPGAQRVETMGSLWWFDEPTLTYLRLPKHEGPRSSPPGEDWGGPGASFGMQDMVWHAYQSWSIVERQLGHGVVQEVLVIELGAKRRVVAPDAVLR